MASQIPQIDAKIIDVWKQAQEMHRHFNTILLQIRNIAFIFAGAVLGAAGTLNKLFVDNAVKQAEIKFGASKIMTEKPEIETSNPGLWSELLKLSKIGVANQIDSLGILLLVAAGIWIGLYFLDRYYYHVLLVGTSKFISDIEKENPELALAHTIRYVNRLQPLPIPFIHANQGRQKVTVFYGIPLVLLISFGLALLLSSWLFGVIAGLVTIIILVLIERTHGAKVPDNLEVPSP